jgi:hypothetical protein
METSSEMAYCTMSFITGDRFLSPPVSILSHPEGWELRITLSLDAAWGFSLTYATQRSSGKGAIGHNQSFQPRLWNYESDMKQTFLWSA